MRIESEPQNRAASKRDVLRWLESEGAIPSVPDAPAKNLRLVDPDERIPDARMVECGLDAIRVDRAGIVVARATVGFRPSQSRRLNASDLEIGQCEHLSDA